MKIPKGGNQNLNIEEEQTTEKVQKDEQRSTKHTHKTKDWAIQTPLKSGGDFRCSGRVSIMYAQRLPHDEYICYV